MKKITTINELMAELENSSRGYYGLRGAYENDMNNLERGYLDCSYDWEDGEPTDNELPGTCALTVNEYMSESEIINHYNRAKNTYSPVKTVLLIADSNSEYGLDEDEIILGHNGYGADVIAIVEL